MRPVVSTAVIALLLACGGTASPRTKSRMIPIGRDVALEVVDWRGRGPPLVFLAGMGNTAHIYDGFAPQFTDQFHVLGVTRRGFGASAGAPAPKDLDTLVSDLTSVLDALDLTQVILAGHSIAGEELTRFAEVVPARCAALIYLDAAYDRTGRAAFLRAYPLPPPPPFTAADSASVAAITAGIARTFRIAVPESEVRAMNRFDRLGHWQGGVAADSSFARLEAVIRRPDYERVRCPSLAIYHVADSVTDEVPYYAALDSAGQRQARKFFHAFEQHPLSRGAFDQFPQNEVIELHHTNHYIFLDRPTQVARAMRTFLAQRR